MATFFNLAITGTAGGRTLNFSSGVLIGATSSAVTVTASGTPQLTLTTQPSAAPASGIVFAQQPQVQLRDAVGNAVSQAGVVVTAAIASGAGTLGGGPTATTNASGVAIFTNLMITGTIGNQALSFSAAGYASVTSNVLSLGAGTPTQITMVIQPSATAASGTAFALQPVLQVRDAQGNAVSVSLTVTAAIASGVGGVLGGATSVVTSALGVATYAGLFINGTAGNFTLGFSVPSLTGATSSTIALTPGAASQLTITTQPVDGAGSGGAFPTQPVIQVRDFAGNAVSVSGTVVTAALASGAAALTGTLTATTNALGVATFANLSITGVAGVRTLIFTAPAVTAVISGNVSP